MILRRDDCAEDVRSISRAMGKALDQVFRDSIKEMDNPCGLGDTPKRTAAIITQALQHPIKRQRDFMTYNGSL